MKRYTTKGTVLNRTDFGEADRILTFLTTDRGKIRAIAKGVRKSRAKLAGSVELFSVSDLTLIASRAEIDTLISARLVKHYGNIVKDTERTKLAYDFMKIINKSTEDRAEPEYFELLDKSLAALDNPEIKSELTELWFQMQLLKLAGHAPNLKTDASGNKLEENKKYSFNFGKMCFMLSSSGKFKAAQIKFLRLSLATRQPKVLAQINGAEELISTIQTLVQTMLRTHVRI